MGDDIDGVVCLAFAFELLLGELPGFFDGGDGDLVGLFAEDVEVFRTGDDVDGVGEGGVQIFKGDEEGVKQSRRPFSISTRFLYLKLPR